MNKNSCCFTGHRKIPAEACNTIKEHLDKAIISLIEAGVVNFLAGGAIGFDTIAARTVIELRKKYPQIKLILMLPCRDQSKGWGEKDVIAYEIIKLQSDRIIYLSESYTRNCMFKRNRALVDNSRFCICYLTTYKGGTAYTIDYAKKKGLKIMNISDNKI